MRYRDIHIELESEVGDLASEIEQLLLAALRTNEPPSDAAPLAVVARSPGGLLVGGLIGSTSYGWLLTKMLWVDESARGCGLGTRMMDIAEQAAVSRGCHSAWLDTSSTRAEAFYRKLGYSAFGVLENQGVDVPAGHRRFFMTKRLPVEPPGRS